MDLIEAPWLVARRDDGGEDSVGLRALLLNAHRYTDLEVELPTQKPAIRRQVLLPVVVDALGFPETPEEWAEHFHAPDGFTGQAAERLTEYLDEHRDRFGLFDPVDPFAQVGGLRTGKDETRNSALIVATAASGNNVPFWSARTDGQAPRLSPGRAAHWLLHTHCWDPGAIKTGAFGDPRARAGKVMGNPTGPLGALGLVLPMGRTLYESLWLNVPFGVTRLAGDLPQWRRRDREGPVEETRSTATPGWDSRPPRGPLDAWTWQARRIRLVPETAPQDADGDGEPEVNRVVVAAGDRLRLQPDHEFHTAWTVDSQTVHRKRLAKDPDALQIRPRRHRAGRAAWRGLDALLAVEGSTWQQDATEVGQGFHTAQILVKLAEAGAELPPDYPLRLELTGIAYNSKFSAIEDTFHDELPLPVAALRRDGLVRAALIGAVAQAERLADAVNRLVADLRRAAGARPVPGGEWQHPGESLLHALDPVVRLLLRLLRTSDEDFDRVDELLRAWEEKAGRETWKVAEHLLAQSPPGLFQGSVLVQGGKTRTYRLSTAERTFRDTLDDTLWRRANRRKGRGNALSSVVQGQPLGPPGQEFRAEQPDGSRQGSHQGSPGGKPDAGPGGRPGTEPHGKPDAGPGGRSATAPDGEGAA